MGSQPALFVPNDLEAHLIAVHKVRPRQIAFYREFCKTQNQDYDEFLKVNHRFLHAARNEQEDE